MEKTPIHFRRVKHGLQKGQMLAVILTGPVRFDEDGGPMVPTFTQTAGHSYAPLTWIRYHTEANRVPPRVATLTSVMRKQGIDVESYPALTDKFRRTVPESV